MLSASDSEGLALGMQADALVEQSTQGAAFEEMLKVVTHAMAKLNLDWPTEQKMLVCSKPDAYFLMSCREQPPCHLLPLFPDLHTEVLRLQKNLYSARVHTNATSTYSMVVGICEQGYLTPCVASLKSALPTRSCRVTSNLVGKAYAAAGQDCGEGLAQEVVSGHC